MFRNSLLSSVIAVTSATLLSTTASLALAAPNQEATNALERQNVSFRFPENGDRVDMTGNPISILLLRQSGGQGRGRSSGQGSGQGTGQGTGQGWRVVGISFGDIERPDRNHEVVIFYPVVNRSGTKGYIVQPAFRAKPSEVGDAESPISQRSFDCGSVVGAINQTMVESGYSLCNSAFSKRDGLATGAMLFAGGPLGIGSFKRFDTDAMAGALVSADVLPLIVRVSAQRDQIGAITYDRVSPTGVMAQVKDRLKARVATAWTHDTSLASQAVLVAAQNKLTTDFVWLPSYKTTLRTTQSPLLSLSPVREGNATPEFDATMASAGTSAGQGGQNSVSQIVASIAPDFGICSASTMPVVGELTTPAERRAIEAAEQLAYLKQLTVDTSSGDKVTLALACTNGPNQPWRLRAEVVNFSGSRASLVKDWRAEDGTLSARTNGQELILTNTGTNFVTIKGISFHIGPDVVTVSKGADGVAVIPPGGEVTLGGTPTLGPVHGKLGDGDLPLRPSLVASEAFAPKVNAGFSILYDAGGPPKTLSRVGPVVVALTAPASRP